MASVLKRPELWAAIDARSNGHPAYRPPPTQHGPLRQFDREMRCANPGCGSPTYFKLVGVPRCMIHCLRQMNDMLDAAGA